jgi:hypothetical protein
MAQKIGDDSTHLGSVDPNPYDLKLACGPLK